MQYDMDNDPVVYYMMPLFVFTLLFHSKLKNAISNSFDLNEGAYTM